jgi:hypothetical protein
MSDTPSVVITPTIVKGKNFLLNKKDRQRWILQVLEVAVTVYLRGVESDTPSIDIPAKPFSMFFRLPVLEDHKTVKRYIM